MRNNGGDVPDRFWQAWRLYAKWGKALGEQAEADHRDAHWRTIQRITAAYQRLAEHEKDHLDDLLKKSDCRLVPLSDPLQLDFLRHRWLDPRREREENYSDWLAWLLERMDSAEQVLRVFGLENSDFGALVREKKAEVSREEPIPLLDRHDKRSDIVIRFGDTGILLVEVKIRDLAEAGGRENLPIYHHWLEGEQPDPKRRYAVLLVPRSIESPCPEWEVRTWKDVSLTLRHRAAQLVSTRPKRLLAAMSLCFAGAVEQNILGYGTGATIARPETVLYVEQFLTETNHGTAEVP
jgi:hypothetical protein